MGIGVAGTNVATETCGQVKPLKTSMTVCVYWIWVYVIGVVLGAEIAEFVWTANCGIGSPRTALAGDRIIEDPASMTGTERLK